MTAPVAYPKWVIPHDTHVATDVHGNRISQSFSQQHIDRYGNLTVLVHSAAEEQAAVTSK